MATYCLFTCMLSNDDENKYNLSSDLRTDTDGAKFIVDLL